MTDVYAGVNGQRLTSVRLVVPNIGPWSAEVDFEAAPDVAGAVTLSIGELELRGTLDEGHSGAFALQRKARIVAGANGWGAEVSAKQYHNDAGVKARLIADDAARAVGESIGDFVPRVERVGRDYARQVGPASRALEDAVGGVAWWVDYAGVTHAGPRPAAQVDAAAYTLLAYDPRDNIATLAVDDPGAVGIGAILADERLDGARTVRSLELRVTADELRVYAWCGGTESSHAKLAALFRAIVQRSTDGRLHGHYRYRVVRMAGDRVELQAVRKVVGLPDLLPLSAWPGIAGAHAELTPGAEVLVAFIEGDRAQPAVVAFAGKDGVGFVPVRLTLGGPSGSPAARQGDIVECQLPPAQFSGTIGGSPASGLLTFTPAKALGLITSGSSKVRVST